MTHPKKGDNSPQVASLQKALNINADGKFGPATEQAVRDFQKKNNLTVDGIVGPKTWNLLMSSSPKPKIFTTQEMIARYGQPGPENQVMCETPFPLRIAWDTKVSVNRFQCHKLVEDKFKAVLQDILDYYGYDRIKELGIDLFGGCYNFRKMRGGNSWSTHAWGVAIDLDPERNKLHETKKTARFARPEYKPMIDIFYKHGFIGLGPEKDYDWMHWQIGV